MAPQCQPRAIAVRKLLPAGLGSEEGSGGGGEKASVSADSGGGGEKVSDVTEGGGENGWDEGGERAARAQGGERVEISICASLCLYNNKIYKNGSVAVRFKSVVSRCNSVRFVY